MGSNDAVTPAELNKMTDDALNAHVSRVLHALNAGDDRVAGVPCVAPFVTADVLLRLHNLVTTARNNGDTCGGWCKQAAVAKVVASFTGVMLKRADAEFVGNAQDSFLHQYRKELSRARNSDSQEVSRARKKGLDKQPMRAAQQMQRVYQCRFGGVPRMACEESSRMPFRKLPVPVKNILPVAQVNLQLQDQIIKLQQEKDDCLREARENLSTLCAAVEHERAARHRAELRAAEVESMQESEAAIAASRVQELKTQLRDANYDHKRAVGQLSRLGCQVATAHVEMARALEREEIARRDADRAVADAAHARAEEKEKAAMQTQSLKGSLKMAEKACRRAEGELACLRGQVCAAHVEVAKARQREEKVRQQAQEAAADAERAQIQAVAYVTNQLRAAQAEKRQTDTERKRAEASLHRLGSQLGTALVEAARAAEIAKSAQSTTDELRARLHEQETSAAQELAHLRELKASMARRARDAHKRAGESDLLRAELKSTREKLKEVRKELNYTQVQLNLNASQGFEEESESEDELVDDLSDVDYSCRKEQVEAEEAAIALKRLRAMPTWRPVRGKGQGKGKPKLEWGTRVIIYSLLSMMVPPAAIGMAIVAIVKRTAPWLNPAAPTYETVKRCRFELRFLEEVRLSIYSQHDVATHCVT